jgi:hypothetical protein
MTFTLEVFEIIQEVISMNNKRTKSRLKAKITENLDAEILDSVVPSYYFSVLTAMMDIEVPDEDIERVQILLRPICRKYTIKNIPTYLTNIFLEDNELDGISSEPLKEKLTDIFSKKDLIAEENPEICDYCCSAVGIVASSMGVSYDKESFEEKINTVLFNTLNCDDTGYTDDEDTDEEFLQVLETGDMIDIEDGREVFKDVEDYTTDEYTDSDDDLYEEIEEKQMEINKLKTEIEALSKENSFLHTSINKLEAINLEHLSYKKNFDDKHDSNLNLAIFGIFFGAFYIFSPAFFYSRTIPDMISMSS